jgi:hypothetical protein
MLHPNGSSTKKILISRNFFQFIRAVQNIVSEPFNGRGLVWLFRFKMGKFEAKIGLKVPLGFYH